MSKGEIYKFCISSTSLVESDLKQLISGYKNSNPGIYIEGVGINAKVFTKGVSSINNQKEVLFILNGVQVGAFSQIVYILNPESIKSITVLKNAGLDKFKKKISM